MTIFADIPEVVVEYVRREFAKANKIASDASFFHPNLHEEMLDFQMVQSLSASPPTFFAKEKAGVAIESHWLGGRQLWDRWEICDIAIFIILRRNGYLDSRKVALLQTKRLYSKEIPATQLTRADYIIGVGRIADRTDQTVPLSRQRSFTFDRSSLYQALSTNADPDKSQPFRIDAYMQQRDIPVYYGFYNPPEIPVTSAYPQDSTSIPPTENNVGHRIQPAQHVHAALANLGHGVSPSFTDLAASTPFDEKDASSTIGWRLENFIADEVLRCRQGKLFDNTTDARLGGLLYARSAPLTSAIAITIDLGDGRSE